MGHNNRHKPNWDSHSNWSVWISYTSQYWSFIFYLRNCPFLPHFQICFYRVLPLVCMYSCFFLTLLFLLSYFLIPNLVYFYFFQCFCLIQSFYFFFYSINSNLNFIICLSWRGRWFDGLFFMNKNKMFAVINFLWVRFGYMPYPKDLGINFYCFLKNLSFLFDLLFNQRFICESVS